MLAKNSFFLAFIPEWVCIVIGFLISFAITYAAIPPIITISKSKKLYDMPNGRTSHIVPTPLLGGVAVFGGLILSTVIAAGFCFDHEMGYMIAGTLLLFFTGIKDDLLIIAPAKKFVAQIAASLIVIVMGDIRVTGFYGFLGIHDIPYIVSVFFTLFVFVVIINGFNLIDGIDGLSSGVGVISSTTFGIWFWTAGFLSYSILCFVLVGSLLAFLRFNLFSRKNKIFLGDSGALVIGITIATVTVRFLQYKITVSGNADIQSAPAIAFGILIYPLFDTLRVFILRVSHGRSPFSADRQHIHHRLLSMGCSHLQATIIIISFNILVILISFTLQGIGNISLIIIQLCLATGFSFLSFRQFNKQPKINFSEYFKMFHRAS